MKKKVIYIIGPYRAPTPTGVLRNIAAAREAALEVWKSGLVALCPHLNTALFDGECEDEVWLDGDKELLRRCDAALLIGRWADSRGAISEIRAALNADLPVFDDIHDLLAWDRTGEWPPRIALRLTERLVKEQP